MIRLLNLDGSNPEHPFPPVHMSLKNPDGLLAAGGGLEPDRLLNAYRHGIFPWYEEAQPILWWSPDPRTVLFPDELRLTKSLRKSIRKYKERVTLDEDFSGVIAACAAPRQPGMGTWITPEMQEAYITLHQLGHAHSVEVWSPDGLLVGGLYGIAIGKIFFGESMFSKLRDTSKVALATLARQLEIWEFALIDCQQDTPHITSLGARTIPRQDFINMLKKYCNVKQSPGSWRLDGDLNVQDWIPHATSK